MVDIRDEDDARARVQERLVTGERIVWVGRPDPNVFFTQYDLFLVPFSLIWGGIALFGCVTALLHADSSSTLFTLPFAAIALYLIVGRFIYKRERKKSTIYAITTSRALVLTGRRSVIDMPIHSASIETREPRSDRHMNAIFRGDRSRPFGLFTRRAYYANTGLDFFDFFAERPVAFYDVADVLGLRAALLASRSDSTDRISNA